MKAFNLLCFSALIITCHGNLNNLVRIVDLTQPLNANNQAILESSLQNNNNRRFGYLPPYGGADVQAGININSGIDLGPGGYPQPPMAYGPMYQYPPPYSQLIG
ncbi:hypothetical protein B5X24_HaOG205500 [Helicoverpa armigera]|nr:hypothetical protein B5X24_HaOG205500 [Helicoverpa armigera]